MNINIVLVKLKIIFLGNFSYFYYTIFFLKKTTACDEIDFYPLSTNPLQIIIRTLIFLTLHAYFYFKICSGCPVRITGEWWMMVGRVFKKNSSVT